MSVNFVSERDEIAESTEGLLAILEAYDQIESMQRVLDAVASLVVSNRLTLGLTQQATALCQKAEVCHKTFSTLLNEAQEATLSGELHTADVAAFEVQATELFSKAQEIRESLMTVYQSTPAAAPFIMPYFANMPMSFN